MKNLILIGGGGHCRSVIEAVESENTYKIIGILDQHEFVGNEILGYPVVGTDEDIPRFIEEGAFFLITIGQIKSSDLRCSIYENLMELNANIATIVASSAVVSNHASIGAGTAILHKTVINANATIGQNTIINTGSIIEHDAYIGNHCHISTGAIINGTSRVGDHCFIGSRCVVNHQLTIGERSIVASGSLVNKNLSGNNTYKGNPVES